MTSGYSVQSISTSFQRIFGMYTVTIYNQATGQCRSTTEATMAACVCLTLGLDTWWWIDLNVTSLDYYHFQSVNNYELPIKQFKKLRQQYNHALRALLCRWISSLASKTVLPSDDRNHLRHIMRLSDKRFLEQMRRFNGMVEMFNLLSSNSIDRTK